ncbi:MAG: hypothetical protein H6673_05685 [Anaerolineales bacterium]|nr:hypothetical protein [Anaerolineales bacterium]
MPANVITQLLAWMVDPTVFPSLLTAIQSQLQRSRSLYEVLSCEVTLGLVDVKGREAIYRKVQKVRFLQDHVIAYEDQAWGDGKLFADYKCSPGIPVDRYQDGNRWRVLISLRESKSRGDVEEFHIRRKIEEGFTKPVEYLHTRIDHPTHLLVIRVVFPAQRLPRRIILIEQNASRTTELGIAHIQTLPDKRQMVEWETKRPRRFEMYTLRWEW